MRKDALIGVARECIYECWRFLSGFVDQTNYIIILIRVK